MPNGPETISTPEEQNKLLKQIEKSLDSRINELRKLDADKAEVLEESKSYILAAFKAPIHESGESSLDDLSITDSELNDIYVLLSKRNTLSSDLLNILEISSYEAFREWIGIVKAHRIDFPSRALNIRLQYPLGFSNKDIKTTQQIFKKMSEYDRELFHIINAQNPEMKMNGVGRIEFTIKSLDLDTNQYIDFHYVANPEGVFAVKKAPSPDTKKKWIEAELNYRRVEKRYKVSAGEDQKAGIKTPESWKDWMDETEEYGPIPVKYRSIVDELQKLYAKASLLKSLTRKRVLVDIKSDEEIHEWSDPLYKNKYGIVHFRNEKAIGFTSYNSGRVHAQAEYFPDQPYKTQKKTWYSLESGQRDLEIEYDENEIAQKETAFRADGGVKYEKVTTDTGTQTEYYLESGQLAFRNVYDEASETRKNFIIDERGKRYGSYQHHHEKDDKLTPENYLNFLAKKLNTPSLYQDQFLFHNDFHFYPIRKFQYYMHDIDHLFFQSKHRSHDRLQHQKSK